jgi:DNA invertase Pin-like site-specific DNA recombinase
MDNRIDALYGRQSIDKADSISIESQLEFCKYELKGGTCKEYTDKGFSGKNIDRPHFQMLLRDIERGLIKRVIVYKLDRISRSIIDFANLMELFQKYHVEFISSTEKFDTSTPMGRAMLNICIVFAQLERETIQKRVTDAYYSRCVKGFKMGGVTPYGYSTEPLLMNGIHTKKLIPNPEQQEIVKLIFEMYAKPEISYGDITRYLSEKSIKFGEKEVSRSVLAQLLKNPVYVQADLDIYEFFKSQGSLIENGIEDFNGVQGCYLYQGRDVAESKCASLKGQHLVVAPHEAVITSEIWLRCRRKLFNNTSFSQTGRKAVQTWLAGKIKCGNCGYALVSQTTKEVRRLYCRKRFDSKGCVGCGTIYTDELEEFVRNSMVQRMTEFRTLTNDSGVKSNPKLTALRVEMAKVETEIEKLVDTLLGANTTLLSYANKKIENLDNSRQSLAKQIADMSADTISPAKILQVSNQLNDWENVSFDDKRNIVDTMINAIRATSENIDVEWKI